MATKCAINGRQWGAYDGRRHVACGAAVEPELESVHAGWHEAIVKALEDRDTSLRRLLEKAQIIRKSQ